ncbi:MAG TPA: glycosyltransferase [Bryobacteraceae bacterium]|nr:glycosyltransferase [Bryobacteraceae bacterium]
MLRHRLLESLYYEHSFPPGFNLYAGILLKLFPAHYAAAFHVLHLILGAAIGCLLYHLMRACAVRSSIALTLSALFMVSPGVVMFENFFLYEYLVVFLLLAAAAALYHFFERKSPGYAAAVSIPVFLLLLVRSHFQLIYLLVIFGCLVYFGKPRRRAIVLASCIPVLLGSAYYLKNWILFGTLSGTTWMGMNMDVITSHQLTSREANALVRAGVISPVSLIDVGAPLSAYASFITPAPETGISVLDEQITSTGAINFENIAFLQIEKYYVRDGFAILRHYPRAYLRSIERAWFSYFLPSGDFPFFDLNRGKIRRIDRFFNVVFFGQWKDASDRKQLRAIEQSGHSLGLILYTGTFLMIGLPLLWAGGIYYVINGWRKKTLNGSTTALLVFVLSTITYLTAVANFLSSFENNRYRFQVDGFFLILFGMALEQIRRGGPDEQLPSAGKPLEFSRHRREYWDSVARSLDHSPRIRAYYRQRLIEIYRFLIPPGMRVLELGCGEGNLLAAVRPREGVGIDLSPLMIERAQRQHPECRFLEGDAHAPGLQEKFDFVICSDLVNDVWDVQRVLEQAAGLSHSSTRLIINTYSRVWELPRRIAESLGIARRLLPQNWLTTDDIVNLLYLANFEVVRSSVEIVWPIRTPLLDNLFNKYVGRLWPFHYFAMASFLIARPRPKPAMSEEPLVSVIVAARNEAGNIANIFDRVPQMGAGTELIFVEGNSTDDTYAAVEREIARRPGTRVKLFKQPGKGKGDAVRVGFREASGELLMILDADLTVPPEDLPRFYEAWRSGKADFVNGVRLVYPMEEKAMRFLNFLGNKFFSLAFSWLLSQSIKDTLCGTKVLSKRDYEVIAANRAYFGEIDPFGDFDLIFGAAKYNLKIVDLPIHYAERTYGETNIQRWSHGWLLLRMVVLAMRRLKFI